MKIEIGEDNGFLFGGVPTLVVVSVTFDDGRRVRFPYRADKAINALYEDLGRVDTDLIKNTPEKPVEEGRFVNTKEHLQELKAQIAPAPDPNKIEKGDIVRCVFLENRNDHAGNPATIDLAVGGLYRVTKVVQGGYMVLDDKAAMKFNLFLGRHEVELAEKGKPIEKKKLFLEEGINCPKCTSQVYCGLHDGFYVGKCECGQDVRVSRKDFKDGQAGNPIAKKTELGESAGVV